MTRKITRRYTEEEFRDAVARSYSIHQTMLKLGMNAAGQAYRTFRGALKDWPTDTSHFTGARWNKGRTGTEARPIEAYLFNQLSCGSNHLKGRLIRAKIFAEVCASCHNHEWMGSKIPLHLDHINGNHDDNSLHNLRLLCPNCHALTPTFCRGGNESEVPIYHGPLPNHNKLKPAVREPPKPRQLRSKVCPDCGVPKIGQNARCLECAEKAKFKIQWPAPEKVQAMVLQMPTLIVAKTLGVSDQAVAKFCKKHGLSKPPRGHWAKVAAGKIAA